MPVETTDVFTIDENYPTANALLVPGPNPESYTVYIFNYSDWIARRQDTSFATAQSIVNSDGTWKGVLDPYQSTPSVPVYVPVQLPILTEDGAATVAALPFTVVAINLISTVVLGLKINPPAYVPSPGSGYNQAILVDSQIMSDDYFLSIDDAYPLWLLPLTST